VRFLALFVPVLLALSLAGCAGKEAREEGALHGLAYQPPLPAPDFSLRDQNGRPFRLVEERGKAVLLFFGYTHCPDVCPATLSSFKRVRSQLGPKAERVRFVFVTVDPERDTPERVKDFLETAGERDFVGLTGSREELEKVWKAYSVYVQKEASEAQDRGYSIVHTASVFLVDPEGRLRAMYSFGTDPRLIASDLRTILGGG
jgi:protein SCO1/2